MLGMTRIYIFLLLNIFPGSLASRSLSASQVSIDDLPKFCVDSEVLALFNPRIKACLVGKSVLDELRTLKNRSAAAYQLSHELIAYHYFVEHRALNKVASCKDADLEYIPLLPLAWKTGYPTRTKCSAGAMCQDARAPDNPACALPLLIKDIVSYQGLLAKRGIKVNAFEPFTPGASFSETRIWAASVVARKPHPFIVAGTFNLRTTLSQGLSSSLRRGTQYETVSAFVRSLYIGHYERGPQCPDVLRKNWIHAVEMPYVAIDLEMEVSLYFFYACYLFYFCCLLLFCQIYNSAWLW
jgi:hypothetical protein